MEKWCSSIHSIGGVEMVSGAYLVQAKQALTCLGRGLELGWFSHHQCELPSTQNPSQVLLPQGCSWHLAMNSSALST